MKRTILFYLLILFKLGVFQAAIFDFGLRDILTSGELPINDNTGLENKIDALKGSISEILKAYYSLLQLQLQKQEVLWQDLDAKVDNIILSLRTMDNKISNEAKKNLAEVKNMIIQQNHLIVPRLPAPVGDGRWSLLADIKDILKLHDDNQETSARMLQDKILKNSQVLQNIDKHVTAVEQKVLANDKSQLAMSKNLEKYTNQSDLTKICFENEKQKLICTTDAYPTSCADFSDKFCSNNTCRIHNRYFGPDPFSVTCDNKSEGGGWTIIQRRMDGSVDFYRDWSEYKKGFGDMDGEFFIGLEKLNALTTTLKPVELLVQLRDFNDTYKYAKYDEFEIGSETEYYNLKQLGKYSGNARDCLLYHKGSNFTTKDRDNDASKAYNCAQLYNGAWWYKVCSQSELNRKYYKTGSTNKNNDGIMWCNHDIHGFDYSLKFTQMAIRPKRV